jgi:hypothetical protein
MSSLRRSRRLTYLVTCRCSPWSRAGLFTPVATAPIGAHTDEVRDTGATRRPWPPWTLSLAGATALLASLLLLIGDGLAQVMASWDSPQPGRGWVRVAAIGHGALMACAVAVLVIGHARPFARRTATIAAWAIIPIGVGWFLLCGRLASS